MYAMAIGELLMLICSGILIRETLNGRMIGDMCRTLIAGAATILLIRLLPALTFFLAIPLCVVAFGGLSLMVGAVNRSDVNVLLASFKKRSPPSS